MPLAQQSRYFECAVGSGVHRFEFPQVEEAIEATSPDTQTAEEREVSFKCFGYFFISEIVVCICMEQKHVVLVWFFFLNKMVKLSFY